MLFLVVATAISVQPLGWPYSKSVSGEIAGIFRQGLTYGSKSAHPPVPAQQQAIESRPSIRHSTFDIPTIPLLGISSSFLTSNTSAIALLTRSMGPASSVAPDDGSSQDITTTSPTPIEHQ